MERSERLKGNGGLMLLKDEKVTHYIETPFAQVYDIIHTTGETFSTSDTVNNFEDICRIFKDLLGEPHYKIQAKEI